MPSLTNVRQISRTAGLSSLLWHRNTSKISALESCPFTQRQFYRETRAEDNATPPPPHFNFLAFVAPPISKPRLLENNSTEIKPGCANCISGRSGPRGNFLVRAQKYL